MKKNIGLVLEGGGFRGCYTAGALTWLLDNDIHFGYSASISAATSFALFYAANDKDALHYVSTKGLKDKHVIGLLPLLNEGGIVGYEYLRTHSLMPHYPESLRKLRESDSEVEIGLYNMTKQKLEYYGKDSFDDQAMYFKASCVLPISNKMTTLNGEKFLDGGIKSMVSIDRAEATGHDKNLVIVTKDKNYVRKPNGFFLANLLRLVYHKYKVMLATLDKRVEAYYYEMGKVQKLEEEGKAILIRPSRDCGVGRFSGTEEQMEEMFQLGYSDMENRRDEIIRFLEEE